MGRGKSWNQEDLDWLKANWQLPDTQLCETLNRPIGTIRTKRRELGLIGKKNERKTDWSDEEIEHMRELWGKKTIPQIAKILGRSEHAVKVKSTRLGLGAFKDSSDFLPARQVSDILGVDCHTVTDYWIPKCGLKFKRIAPQGKKYFTYIKITDLLTWLKNNPDKWDSRKTEPFALGSEPAWLKEKRKSDHEVNPKGLVKWTPLDKAKLVKLYREGLKIQDIADTLGRSHAGVEHRIARLDVWGKGTYIGNKRQEERKAKTEAFEMLSLQTRLVAILRTRQNELNFDGYWQKDLCMNWNSVKGCTAGCTSCDDCGNNFRRIPPQYCVRCGATFFEREENLRCPRCRDQRRKQAARKYYAKGGSSCPTTTNAPIAV